ncbi:MAG: methylated-DNA--[protein]-cysteine S-methyltransferase [Saprospirales bacterium]|nr:methylated-DNA--[protein]-cysteine S-methyltransferase [Saprospirales bacterium]
MESTFISYLQTPIGELEIIADENSVLSVTFNDVKSKKTNVNENEISIKCKQQLQEYFNESRKIFELTLNFNGTDFQNKVWTELQNISIGKTISYLQLAKNLGDAKCIRAAASANGKNPFAIIVPCHRVIGKDGSLTGYAGGLWRKQWLLEHENNINKQVSLFV